MKKYIYMVVMVISVIAFASCTNDAIEISKGTNFKINPATVIAPFTYEVSAGELEGINSNYRLRIRLLIYNTSGILVEEESQFFTSYATVVATSKSLAKGDYTAIAISDIVIKDELDTYWLLSDYKNLSTATIVKTDYIGDYGREILGVAKTAFSVNENENEDVNINILPAGSLFVVSYWGIQQYADEVDFYELAVSKYVIDCKFDKQGNFTPSWENCNFEKRVNVHDTEGDTGNRYYHYAYILPTSNLKLKYRAYTKDEEYIDLTEEMVVSPKAGEEYRVILDLDEHVYYVPELVNGENNRAVNTQIGNISGKHSLLYLNDIK